MSPALLLLAVLAAAEEQRVAVVIGNDAGDAGEVTLDYAETDAVRFRELLVEAAGVEADRTYLVTGGGAKEARRALAEAAGRISELRRLGPTAFIVYVSSHADRDALHLGGDHLAMTELEETLRASRATLRLAIVDACRGAPSRSKGGRPVPEVALAIGTGSSVEGQVIIGSASPGEPAQEWAGLRGSLFTHHLLAGLRGLADTDGDGRVTLQEAYAYAFRRTVASSTAGPAAQHPSFSMDMKGFGEWTFARPAELGATLALAADLEGPLWVIDTRRRELVAEVAKGRGEITRLSVRPGWYRVARFLGSFSEVAEVNLAFGGERTITADALSRTTATRATLRGGAPIDLRPWRLGAGYRFSTGLVSGAESHLGEVALRRAEHDLFLGLRAAAGGSTFRAGASRVGQVELELALRGGLTFALGPFELDLGLELAGTYVLQSFRRDDGAAAEVPRDAVVPGVGLVAELALPITDALWLSLGATPSLRLVDRYDDTRALRLVADLHAAAAWCF